MEMMTDKYTKIKGSNVTLWRTKREWMERELEHIEEGSTKINTNAFYIKIKQQKGMNKGKAI